jgi:hypothetical protein
MMHLRVQNAVILYIVCLIKEKTGKAVLYVCLKSVNLLIYCKQVSTEINGYGLYIASVSAVCTQM